MTLPRTRREADTVFRIAHGRRDALRRSHSTSAGSVGFISTRGLILIRTRWRGRRLMYSKYWYIRCVSHSNALAF